MAETGERVDFEPAGENEEPEAIAESAEPEASEAADVAEGDESSVLEMLEYIARALVSNPDAVSVTEHEEDNHVHIRLSVDEHDKGKIIGRDGRVAQSIRALLRVAATKAGTRVSLEIE